jgi:hypothetical protein
MAYVLEWFYELHQERAGGPLGTGEALSSEKLESWSRLNGIRLVAYELEAIRRLDRLFMSRQYEKEETE